jgi:hypothetical protein
MVGMSYLLLMLGGQRKEAHLHFVIVGDILDPLKEKHLTTT